VKGGPRPRGAWVPLHLVEGDREDRLQACLFARGGSIIPLGPPVQHTGEAPEGATTLLVVPGENGQARGRLYHDAGDGFEYRDGDFRCVTFGAELRQDDLEVAVLETLGRRPGPPEPMAVACLEPSGELRAIKNTRLL